MVLICGRNSVMPALFHISRSVSRKGLLRLISTTFNVQAWTIEEVEELPGMYARTAAFAREAGLVVFMFMPVTVFYSVNFCHPCSTNAMMDTAVVLKRAVK